MTDRRDFLGYGDAPPDPRWPGGARLAVSVVVNVEEGAELSVGDGDERNETVHEVVEEVVGAPDLCMESHFEYGARAGFRRILRVLDAHGVKATFSASARAFERSPWMAREIVASGHEVSAHSWRWERHANMDEAAERAVITRAVAAIEAAAGVRPVGWHTRSSASAATRRLVVEEGGFLYDSDAYNDDLPWVAEVSGRSHVVLPYAFDTNDMRFTRQGGFTFGADFARYCGDAFDTLHGEGGRMMSVGLHLRIIGRPGRIGGLDALLGRMREAGDVWFARRMDIARHWRARVGLPPFGEG
ncbi:polysaccharide deacetylase family protein [Rubrimonas cliftonensis]|uniref:Chitooligosaccharide deacetylase n=1 Tax=Rubrimonas cliftonensis TaxID=89524 RepID=A0A1H4AAI5_9RHOB|nr:polysaccharide deacetylase family protein [Rubrimonas cliftonensis]SEA33143.1 Peptidoglycan/xylan/chitin deacetylase, PgdA/CDA1 family [Rubrimonas cliftonensis]